MWKRLFSTLGIGMLLLVGSALAQSDPAAQPAPTATLSLRGMVRIFQMLRVNYGLVLDNDTGFDSYSEISIFIQHFARKYLRIDPHIPYSARINIGFMGYDQFDRMARSFSEPIGFALHDYLYTMYDKQAVIASVGLREDGFALVYTDHCTSPICNTPQEQMQRYQGEALGLYVMYVPGNVEDEVESLALIQHTFPALSRMSLSHVHEQNKGYSFSVYTSTQIYGVETPLFYYVGTVSIPRYTLVYALVGVGTDATSIMLPHISEIDSGVP